MKVIAALSSLVPLAPAAALAGAPAPAGPAASAAQGGAQAAAPPAEKLICRREAITGARTGGQKTCLTKRQWRAYDRGGDEELRRELNRTR